MKVVPKTDQEIAELGLFPKGIYDFEITKAEERISAKKPDGKGGYKGGNEMIVLDLTIFDHSTGSARFITDYLLDIPSMAFKTKHAAEACGVLEEYESGMLYAMNFEGKTGKALVDLQEGASKEDGSKWPARNVIKDYVKPTGIQATKEENEKELDDSIPF